MSVLQFDHSPKSEVIKFLLVGGLSTAVNYITFLLLHQGIQWHYILSSSLGYMSGIVVGYLLNRQWTFGHRSSLLMQHWEFLLYCIVYFVSLGLSLILLTVLVDNLGFAPWLANIVGIVQSTLTNFVGLRIIVFRQRPHIQKV